MFGKRHWRWQTAPADVDSSWPLFLPDPLKYLFKVSFDCFQLYCFVFSRTLVTNLSLLFCKLVIHLGDHLTVQKIKNRNLKQFKFLKYAWNIVNWGHFLRWEFEGHYLGCCCNETADFWGFVDSKVISESFFYNLMNLANQT